MPTMTQNDTELTLTEAAALLGMSEDTARKLITSGAIHAWKQGRQWRMREKDVRAYKQRIRDEGQSGHTNNHK